MAEQASEPKTIDDYRDIVKILKLKVMKQMKQIQELEERVRWHETAERNRQAKIGSTVDQTPAP